MNQSYLWPTKVRQTWTSKIQMLASLRDVRSKSKRVPSEPRASRWFLVLRSLEAAPRVQDILKEPPASRYLWIHQVPHQGRTLKGLLQHFVAVPRGLQLPPHDFPPCGCLEACFATTSFLLHRRLLGGFLASVISTCCPAKVRTCLGQHEEDVLRELVDRRLLI